MIYLLNLGALDFNDFTRAPTIKKGIVMCVKLTFRKDFGCENGHANLMPCTIDGEEIWGVIACTVESGANQLPVMTLKVHIMETFAQNAAVRLKK